MLTLNTSRWLEWLSPLGDAMRRIAVPVPTLLVVLVSCGEKIASDKFTPDIQSMKITYLKKANDDVISFCSCVDGRVTFPAQLDCPWCGCGWLFSCVTCRKAFTFAEGVQLEATWEEIAREDIRKRWEEEPTDDDVASWVESMKELLSGVRPGGRYVIIDGSVIAADSQGITFDGWHSHHDFASLPQIEALSDKSVLDEKLSNREYWQSTALPED